MSRARRDKLLATLDGAIARLGTKRDTSSRITNAGDAGNDVGGMAEKSARVDVLYAESAPSSALPQGQYFPFDRAAEIDSKKTSETHLLFIQRIERIERIEAAPAPPEANSEADAPLGLRCVVTFELAGPVRDFFEERAAIMTYDGGCPEESAEIEALEVVLGLRAGKGSSQRG